MLLFKCSALLILKSYLVSKSNLSSVQWVNIVRSIRRLPFSQNKRETFDEIVCK